MPKKIDVKRTIETTLDRAKGWGLGKYPSRLNPDLNMKIEVIYPRRKISLLNKKTMDFYDFSSKPVCVRIQRDTTKVTLRRNSYLTEKGWDKLAYSFSIYTPFGERYIISETHDGKIIRDNGNPFLLSAMQKDPDFSQYISFFTQDEQENSRISTQGWQLNKTMAQSREITR